MDMNGSQRIEASREAVYAALNDVDILRQCIPGCDSIEKTSETEMVAKVTLRIGPVKASFAGTVTLSDLDPPNGYTISGEGSGGMAGFAKGGANVTLEPDGDATILHYVVKAEIGGKLAQMGSRLIDSTAKKLDMPAERVVLTVETHANTSAASIPLALDTAVKDGRVKRGDLLLLEAMGGGLTWGASLVRW